MLHFITIKITNKLQFFEVCTVNCPHLIKEETEAQYEQLAPIHTEVVAELELRSKQTESRAQTITIVCYIASGLFISPLCSSTKKLEIT